MRVVKVRQPAIPARTTVYYLCGICGHKYKTSEAAKKCESRPLQAQRFVVGDLVEWLELATCSRLGRNFHRRGSITKVDGPLIRDEDHWMRAMPGFVDDAHDFQYTFVGRCICGEKREYRHYGGELKFIRHRERGTSSKAA